MVRFDSPFITGDNAVNLNNASCMVEADQISIVDATVDGAILDLCLNGGRLSRVLRLSKFVRRCNERYGVLAVGEFRAHWGDVIRVHGLMRIFGASQVGVPARIRSQFYRRRRDFGVFDGAGSAALCRRWRGLPYRLRWLNLHHYQEDK